MSDCVLNVSGSPGRTHLIESTGAGGLGPRECRELVGLIVAQAMHDGNNGKGQSCFSQILRAGRFGIAELVGYVPSTV